MNFWEDTDRARRIYEQYGGKSEQQLMSELENSVRKMKQEGTFDPNSLENLYRTVSPYLNEEQSRRMRAIIDMLTR